MKVILFDLDGTLVRAGGAGRKALDLAAYKLYGKKNVAKNLNIAGRTDLRNFAAAYRAATGKKPAAAAVERLHRCYLECLPRFVRRAVREKTYVLPTGIKALLKRLSREKSVLLGLGTGNMQRGAHIKLKPSGFLPYFSFGGFGADGFHRATMLRKAVHRARRLAAENFGKNDVFVVGDTPWDVAGGKKAGFKTVAVGTGFAAWKDLVKAKPDFLARDFRGVNKWLRWLKLKT